MNEESGEDHEAEAGVSDQSPARTLVFQIMVIAIVGSYLFGMVMLYIWLPWAAAAVITVAASILVLSFLQPPDSPQPPL